MSDFVASRTLVPTDIAITIQSTTRQEEIDSWQWLFGIHERYRGKLCKKRGGYDWLKTVVADSASYKMSPQAVLGIIRDNCAKDPFRDDGFLKLPFLEVCEQAGLLDPPKID